jgi:hypothetical protein
MWFKMTNPRSDELIPCRHSKDGWCLSCVKELIDKGSTIEIGRPFNFSFGNGESQPAGVVVSFGVVDSSRGFQEMNHDSSHVRHLEPLPEVHTKYEIICEDFCAAPVSRPAKTQPITELYSKGERKRAPVSSPPSPQEITVLSYKDNSPPLFDPLSIVLSVLGTSIIFVLLWMMR